MQLRARRGSESWLEPGRVLEIARDFGSLLPYDIRVDGRPINDEPAPWLVTHYSADEGDWTPHFDGALSEAYASAIRAVELFTGPEEWRVERLGCVLLAGELAHALADEGTARVHLTEVVGDSTDSDRAADLRDAAASVLEWVKA